MADNNDSGNSNNGLYFLVGGLVVVVGIIAFVYFDGGLPGTEKTNITIEAPANPAPSTTTTTTQ